MTCQRSQGIEEDIDKDIEEDIKEIDKEKPTRHKYGEYQNVLLTDEDLEKLKKEFLDWSDRIERLSAYMASTGKSYKNHLATIRNWARRDSRTPTADVKPKGQASYDISEFERQSMSKPIAYKKNNAVPGRKSGQKGKTMDCNKTTNFLAELQRLCDSRDRCMANAANKEQCPMFGFCEDALTRIGIEDATKLIETIQKWSDEHPKKTYAQDFLRSSQTRRAIRTEVQLYAEK